MRKKFLRLLLVVVILLVVAASGGYAYLRFTYPRAGQMLPLTLGKADSATLARGKYLATNVAGCIDCHTPRQMDKFGLPIQQDSLGKGGVFFSRSLGFPGDIYSANITPAGIGKYSDAELYHAVTTGVNKAGNVIFPVMPYGHYKDLDPEDLKAILAYIRTLQPHDATYPAADVDFPVSLFIRTEPAPVGDKPHIRPAETDKVAYGKYIYTMAACDDCHTPKDKGQPIAGKELAGGFEFNLKGIGLVRSANITPDMETGIGAWTEDNFVSRFKFHAQNPPKPWKEVGYATVMPWQLMSGMKETDLRAIYAYLRTVKPIKNQVVRFEPEKAEASASN